VKAIIIGGGPAGLSAAYTLEKNGITSLILERQNRVGGRMLTEHKDGYIVDLGTQFFSARYKATINLCRELGLVHQLTRFKLAVGVLHNGKIRSGRRILRYPNWLSFAHFLSWLFLNGHRLNVAHPERLVNLDTQSVTDFALQRYNRELLENWFQPFISSATSALPEEVSIACALTYMWYNLAPGLTLKQGTAALSQSLQSVLPAIQLNASVKQVILKNNKIKGVEFEYLGKKERIDTEAVIVATPAPVAANFLSNQLPSLRKFLQSVSYTRCIHVAYGLRRKVLKDLYAVAIPRRAGLHLAILSEDTYKCAEYAPPDGGILHAITYSNCARELWNQPDDVIEALISSEVRKILPEFPRHPLFSLVHRWQHNMCLIKPGHIRALMAFQQQIKQIEGLRFAGDYLSVPCLEGAILSGQWAAKHFIGNA